MAIAAAARHRGPLRSNPSVQAVQEAEIASIDKALTSCKSDENWTESFTDVVPTFVEAWSSAFWMHYRDIRMVTVKQSDHDLQPMWKRHSSPRKSQPCFCGWHMMLQSRSPPKQNHRPMQQTWGFKKSAVRDLCCYSQHIPY